jgi:hypothetical protein
VPEKDGLAKFVVPPFTDEFVLQLINEPDHRTLVDVYNALEQYYTWKVGRRRRT